MTEADRLGFPISPKIDTIFPGVHVPESDPTDEPKLCLTYNVEYRNILITLMRRMIDESAWLGNDEDKQAGIAKASTLMQMMQDPHCPEGLPDGLCTDYSPLNPFTTYYPNNPYTSPEHVPSGYAYPPFYTGVTNPILGILPDDVMTDILRLNPGATLPDLIGFSFPTIHIDLEGTGELELEFVKILQGGFVTVTVDSNPFQARIVDLNAVSITDFTGIFAILGIIFGGSLISTQILEIEFETPGEHTVDIVFYPNVGGSEILGFGGGLRRMSFCDTSIDGDTRYMPISNIRVNETTCKWEAEYNGDGVWVEIGDYWVEACAPEITVPDQTEIRVTDCQIEQSFDGGDTWEDVAGGYFYPITATCPAERFIAKLALADLLLRDASNVQQMRVGLMADTTLNEIDSRPRSLQIKYATNGQMMSFEASSGRVRLDTTFPGAESVKAAFSVFGRDSNDYVQQLRGRTGQVQPILALFSTNTAVGAADMIAGNFTGEGFNFRVKSQGELQYKQTLTTLAKPASGGNAIAHEIRSSFASGGVAPLKGDMQTMIYDNGVAREAVRILGEGGVPKIGFLGASPSDRMDVGNIDCHGNAAAYAALNTLKTFGFIKATNAITLGSLPNVSGNDYGNPALRDLLQELEDAAYINNASTAGEICDDPNLEECIGTGGDGENTGVTVPTLPEFSGQSDAVLCSVAEYLAEWIGELSAWLTQVTGYAADVRSWLDIINLDAYLDFDLNFFESNGKIDWNIQLQQAHGWYLTHESDASTWITSELVDAAADDTFKNAIFAALRATTGIFDAGCFSLVQANIGALSTEYSDAMADAMGLLPLWYWQRLVYIATKGTAEGCDTLPPEDWSHTENYVATDWDAITQVEAAYLFGVGYTRIGFGNNTIIELTYAILTSEMTLTLSRENLGVTTLPTVKITDIHTGIEYVQSGMDWGTNVISWDATFFPQGSEGLRWSIICPADTQGTFSSLHVSGYGVEPQA